MKDLQLELPLEEEVVNMRKMIHDALILCIITLTAGALLASVYEITKEPIRLQEEATQKKACQEVFMNAASFETNGSQP